MSKHITRRERIALAFRVFAVSTRYHALIAAHVGVSTVIATIVFNRARYAFRSRRIRPFQKHSRKQREKEAS